MKAKDYKFAESTCFTLGRLCAGHAHLLTQTLEQLPPSAQKLNPVSILLHALFTSADQSETVAFAAGQAFSLIAHASQSDSLLQMQVLQDMKGIDDVDVSITQMESAKDYTIHGILRRILREFVSARQPMRRQSASIWLVSLVKFTHSSLILPHLDMLLVWHCFCFFLFRFF